MLPTELSHVGVFRLVPPHHLQHALDVALTPFEIGAGELLLVEGEKDDSLLFVIDGQLEVVTGDPAVRIAEVGAGEILGEMALFGVEERRRASVRTLTASRLVILDREGLARLRSSANALVPVVESACLRSLGKRLRGMNERIAQVARGTELEPAPREGVLSRLKRWLVPDDPHPEDPPPSALDVLRLSPSFARTDEELLAALAEELEVVPVPEGTVLIAEGSHGQEAYILADGRIDVYRSTRGPGSERIAELGPGSFFGLVSFVHGSVRSATCFAASPCWVLRFSRQLWTDLEGLDTPAATALRMAVHDALSAQLASANHHFAYLVAALASDRGISEREREAFAALVVGTA